MLDNLGWQAELRKTSIDDFRQCRFPGSTEIAISGDRDRVTMTLTKKGLHANMQTDAAAFEAWALALLCHCDVKNVVIAVEEGLQKPDKGPETQHFERFLYRLTRFAELFPDQVTVDRELAGSARALGSERGLFMNQPSSHRPEVEREARIRKLFDNAGRHSESDLEKALEVSDTFRKMLGLEKVMRQWPVGLFDGRVDNSNRVFNGGKSAIDLIGIRGTELVLVELKKDGNRKAGAISELLFYSSLMRDVLKGHFKFAEQPQKRNCAMSGIDIMHCTSISGVLLAPAMHPLIGDPAIVSALNAAFARRWSDLPVRFDVVLIGAIPKQLHEEFSFNL